MDGERLSIWVANAHGYRLALSGGVRNAPVGTEYDETQGYDWQAALDRAYLSALEAERRHEALRQ
ncbi:MAG: hypothetical protein ACR2LH_09135 [Thermoleophilaceae bacterium]